MQGHRGCRVSDTPRELSGGVQPQWLQEVALCVGHSDGQWPWKMKSNSVFEKQSFPSKRLHSNWRETAWSVMDMYKTYFLILSRKQVQVQNTRCGWEGLSEQHILCGPREQALPWAVTVSLAFTQAMFAEVTSRTRYVLRKQLSAAAEKGLCLTPQYALITWLDACYLLSAPFMFSNLMGIREGSRFNRILLLCSSKSKKLGVPPTKKEIRALSRKRGTSPEKEKIMNEALQVWARGSERTSKK